MRANGYLDRLIAMLDKQGIGHALFDKILPNPVLRHVHEGAALAREQGCDFVIGLGGGSSIDSAKSIAVMAKNPGDYWDYISGGSGKGQPLVNGALPIVAIATTAGTGTEADPWTVITKEDTNEKIGFGCAETFPVLSVVDPEMMLTIPAHLTAYQGFDALFHATEGYIANVATPLSDAYALKSIELLAKYLPAAVKDGSDLEARTQVALASTLSGMVESTSCCTSEHGMEHALSAFYPKLPHGAGLIMLSEAYYSFFADKPLPWASAVSWRHAGCWPAYITALGTQSSAATIPVTLEQTIKNGVHADLAGFVIPLCATIHLSGSTMKIVAFR